MAFVSYHELWKTELYNKGSAKDRVQDINANQLKFKVNDTYKKNENITTNF